MDINKKIFQRLLSENVMGKKDEQSVDAIIIEENMPLMHYQLFIPDNVLEGKERHIEFWAKSDSDAFAIATMNKLPSLLLRIDKDSAEGFGSAIYINKDFDEDGLLYEEVLPEDIELEKYNDEQKKNYKNHGKSWEKEEEELLNLLYVEKKCSLDILSISLERNRNEIIRKLTELNILNK